MTATVRRDSRVVIFTDDPGWHGRVLVAALARRGITARFQSLKNCTFELGEGPPRILIPGFDGMPRGAFVRGVPGGTLEEVILRLNFLHWLALLDVPVFNSGRAIERTVDKAMTSFLLGLHGIATPRTWVLESPVMAAEVLAPVLGRGSSVVIKPLFGSQGEGLERVRSLTELATISPIGGVFYAQEFLECGGPPYRDWRVFVIAGQARFAMERSSQHWITNRAQGAECRTAPLTDALVSLAEAAAAAVMVDYAGVDLMRDEAGRWWVGEVNGVPAWWGLTQATGTDVTACLVEAFIAKLACGNGGTDLE